MKLFNLGGIIEGVGKIADNLHTSDKEKLELALEEKKLDLERHKIDTSTLIGQQEINKAEAQHKSIFVAGWRPAVGWVCALALLYKYVGYPLLVWAMVAFESNMEPPPQIGIAELSGILMVLLGARTYEKRKGISTEAFK